MPPYSTRIDGDVDPAQVGDREPQEHVLGPVASRGEHQASVLHPEGGQPGGGAGDAPARIGVREGLVLSQQPHLVGHLGDGRLEELGDGQRRHPGDSSDRQLPASDGAGSPAGAGAGRRTVGTITSAVRAPARAKPAPTMNAE